MGTMSSMSSMASATPTSSMSMSSMGSMSMSHMGSMSMSSMASMTMSSMASMTMSSMPSMSMGDMDHSHNHGSGHMAGMNMYLTTKYNMYPVLFSTLSASNGGQAFGIFVLIVVVCFVSKGLEFLKNYLEVRVWNNPNYKQETTIIEQCECDEKDIDGKSLENQTATAPVRKSKIPLARALFRDSIRLILCFLPELLSWAMMLVAMSFVLLYFFGVVFGMAFGRFFFESLSNRYNIRPGGNNFQGHH